MNLPNSLTIARILLAPVLALVMVPGEGMTAAVIVFAAGMGTDFADGYLARTRGDETRLGTLLDPIADKLFVGTALVCLAATGRLAVWVLAVIFAREAAVTLMRLAARGRGVIIPANALGKAKTATQSLLVLVLLLANPDATPVLVLVLLTVAITILSGVVYGLDYLRERRVPVPRAPVRTPPVGARVTAG